VEAEFPRSHGGWDVVPGRLRLPELLGNLKFQVCERHDLGVSGLLGCLSSQDVGPLVARG
jgi:hypothetical protein